MRNDFELGERYVTIFLDRKNKEPLEVVVDYIDFMKLLLLDVKWCAHETTCATYAKAKKWNKETKKAESIMMHRFIMNTKSKEVVDHVDHDGLNNRRGNLRNVTTAENAQNLNLAKNNSTGVRGVSFNKQKGKYEAYYHLENKKIRVGLFDTVEDAEARLKETRDKEYKYI